MQFRKDINGLRAIAVIAVVLFHFNSSWLPGGFAGVDVFFVISGFLMTGIIFRGIEQEDFSILKFYVARANRIIPALAVLCLVLLIFGWFYLVPFDYRGLGKHIGSSMGFLSNIIYWTESGYFSASSHEKWLLHTWSLSVEWQFYILYPLVLVAMRKFMSVDAMKKTILIGTVLGFIFCVVVTYRWPNPAYYLLSTRAWEMMVGGVAFLYPFSIQSKRKKFIEWLGLTLIIGSYVLISGENPWPGYLAILPVLGTFFIIQAQRNDSFITSNVVFQKIGSWSYSIYLWHWPITVAIYYFSLNDIFIYIGIILSVLLGFLSNKYIEKIKFRNDFSNIFSLLTCKPIYVLLCVGFLGSYTYLVDGHNLYTYTSTTKFDLVNSLKKNIIMPTRDSGYCFYSNDDPSFKVDKVIGTNCVLGDKTKKPNTLLFGDSYAGTYEPFLNAVFNKQNSSFNSVVTNWCAPSLTSNIAGPKNDTSYEQCLLNREYLGNTIESKKYDNIIFAGSWEITKNKKYFDDVKEVIDFASNNSVNVILLPTPLAYKKNPLSKYYRQIYNEEKINLSTDVAIYDENNKFNDILSRFAENYENVYFLSRNCIFNEDGLFDYKGLKVPYSLDGGHMSLLGSLYAETKFEKSTCYNDFLNRL